MIKPKLATVLHGNPEITETGLIPQPGITVDIVKYDHTAEQLKKSLAPYKGFKLIPGDKASEATMKEGLRFCRTARPAIERRRIDNDKLIKSAIEHYIENNHAEAEALQALIESVEPNLKAEKEKEDKRLADIEAIKINKVKDYILDLQSETIGIETLTIEELNAKFEILDSSEIDPSVFTELKDKDQTEYIMAARLALSDSRQAVHNRIKDLEKIAEQKIEDDRLAKQKAEQDARQYDIDWSEAILMNKEFDFEKDCRIKQAVINAENARIKAESDRIEREKREADIRAEEKVKAEAAALAKGEADRLAKIEQDKKDAAEKVRLEALKSEKERCLSYIELLSKIEQPELKDENLIALLKRMTDGIKLIKKLIQETR